MPGKAFKTRMSPSQSKLSAVFLQMYLKNYQQKQLALEKYLIPSNTFKYFTIAF